MRPSSPVIALLLGGIAPALVTAGRRSPPVARALAAALLRAARCSPTSPGMLIERWLFFAEARHAVMNYYGG